MKKKIEDALIWILAIIVIICLIMMFNKTNFTNKSTSSDIVPRSSITSYNNDYVKITHDCISIGEIEGSGSMEITFGKGHNLITTECFNKDKLSTGDIIGYEMMKSHIVHRIVKIDEDNKGWYAVTQGDNCNYKDEKVRFDQIEVLVLGVVY